MSPIRVAILGTGMSLQVFHLPIVRALPDKFVLRMVMERSGKATCRDLVGPDVKVVSTYQEVLDDADVDLVVVGTPNKTHFEYCQAALKAGKHVLCEKPVCPTAKEAEELFALAKSMGKILCVFQNRRWDSDFLTLRALLKSNQLGPLVEYTSHYDRYKPLSVVNRAAWKEKPGEYNDSIYNLGSHIIDQAIVLFGKPQKVLCRSWGQRAVEGLDDSFDMTLTYPPTNSSLGPLHVHLRATMLSALSPQLRFSIKGLHASYVKYAIDPLRSKPAPDGAYRGEGYGPEPETAWGHVQRVVEEGKELLGNAESVPAEAGNYPAIYENIFDAIQAGNMDALNVTPAQAVLNIQIIQAGLQSSREERSITL